MALKIGINGMGRIGRTVLRELVNRGVELEVCAVNDLCPVATIEHLINFDSVHGRFGHEVKSEGNMLKVGNQTMTYYSERDPSNIPWEKHDIQLVIDSTGIFKDKASLGKHMKGSVKKVMMCAPGKDLDGTFVMGVNNESYDSANHHIISNASCTTNCLAPLAKVLNEKFGIESGLMTTIHSYTGDQPMLDAAHSDLRRARAGAVSMIPTTTGAAAAVGKVIPALNGKLDGYAVRVPTPNVSLVDLTATLKNVGTKEEINAALKEAANGELKGVLFFEERPLVSCDYMSNRASSTVDASLTNVNGNQVKVVSWYDNEAGYSNRVVDLALYVGSKL